jgi:hypothetical protein
MQELNDADNQLIFSNINGDMTDAERALFEQRCQEDAAFRAEVAAYDDAKSAAFIGGRARVKDILKQEAAQFRAEQPTLKIVHLRTWILRGAAATLLMGVGLGVFQYVKKQKVDNLYADNFKPLDNAVITRFRGNDSLKIDAAFRLRHDAATLALSEKAFDAYSNKEYAKSITFFNQVKTADDTLDLYKANAFLAVNDVEKATIIFTNLTLNGKGYTKEFSTWYLALTYLKQEKRAECSAILQQIMATPTHPFYREASQLVQQMSLIRLNF